MQRSGTYVLRIADTVPARCRKICANKQLARLVSGNTKFAYEVCRLWYDPHQGPAGFFVSSSGFLRTPSASRLRRRPCIRNRTMLCRPEHCTLFFRVTCYMSMRECYKHLSGMRLDISSPRAACTVICLAGGTTVNGRRTCVHARDASGHGPRANCSGNSRQLELLSRSRPGLLVDLGLAPLGASAYPALHSSCILKAKISERLSPRERKGKKSPRRSCFGAFTSYLVV